MPSFLLNKLIRDKVLTSMQELGQSIRFRRLKDDEFVAELHKKLLEETAEFDPAKPDAAKELADILEVVETLGNQLGYDRAQLHDLQQELRKKRGSFDNRIYVDQLTLNDDDPWVAYYQAEPERFKQVD